MFLRNQTDFDKIIIVADIAKVKSGNDRFRFFVEAVMFRQDFTQRNYIIGGRIVGFGRCWQSVGKRTKKIQIIAFSAKEYLLFYGACSKIS